MASRTVALKSKTYRLELRTTLVLGLGGVILTAIWPFTSDVFHQWMRQADLVVGGLFSAGQLEYPPIGSFYLQALNQLPAPGLAVMLNALIMVAGAAAITWVIAHHSAGDKRSQARLWAFSPALIFLLPLNFDVAAALMALIAIVTIGSKRVSTTGAAIAVGTLIKVFPGALVFPLLPLIQSRRKRIVLLVSSAVVLLFGYAMFALFHPDTWLLHFQFAQSRQDAWTSLWRFVDPFLGASETSNLIIGAGSTIGVFAALAGIAIWAAKRQPPAAVVAVVAVVAFLILNKVFKPQYILWVTPLYAFAGGKKIWMRLLEYSAMAELSTYYLPMPQWFYVLSLLSRSVALMAMIGIARQHNWMNHPVVPSL